MTDEITNDDDRIDAERACLRGRTETRDRLRAMGWTNDEIAELEDYADGFFETARAVASEVRWRRDRGQDTGAADLGVDEPDSREQ